MDKEIIISFKTILFAFLLILAGYVFYRLGPIFGIFLVSTLIVISTEHLVNYIRSKTFLNKPVSRSLAVVISYLLLVIGLIAVLTVGLPPVLSQISNLFTVLSGFFRKINLSSTVLDSSMDEIVKQLASVSGGVLSVTLSVFSNLVMVFSILIISIYMSLDWENLKERFLSFFPDKTRKGASDTLSEIEVSIGQWVKGQLLLMFIVGSVSTVGLIILDVDYPLALGLVSGLLEIVPMLGPIISAVLAAIVGFADAPIKGIGVVVLFFVIQQLENNILVPKIMQKVSGFSPLIILLALLVGSEFFGIIGAVLAIPTTMIGTIILRRVLVRSK